MWTWYEGEPGQPGDRGDQGQKGESGLDGPKGDPATCDEAQLLMESIKGILLDLFYIVLYLFG